MRIRIGTDQAVTDRDRCRFSYAVGTAVEVEGFICIHVKDPVPTGSFTDSFLAAAKSPGHGMRKTFAPNDSAIEIVLSSDPVSRTTISSTNGRTLFRQRGRFFSSFLTIMQSEMRGSIICHPQDDVTSGTVQPTMGRSPCESGIRIPISFRELPPRFESI